MKSIRVFAGGKVNLSLNICGTSGGLHLLDSVMTSVSLGDVVTVTLRSDDKVRVQFVQDGATLDLGEDNSAARTVKLVQQTLASLPHLNNNANDGANSPMSDGGMAEGGGSCSASTHTSIDGAAAGECDCGMVKGAGSVLEGSAGVGFGVDILVEKGLPVAGGLGGSSVDIAAVLVALSRLLGRAGSGLDLPGLAAELGSDVPFMLHGGCARVTGTGEIISDFDSKLSLFLVVATLGKGVSSGAAYARFDELNPLKTAILTDNDSLVALMQRGDSSAIGLFENALTGAAESLCGGIETLLAQFRELGALGQVMTGSGSCVCGFFPSIRDAERAAERLRAKNFWAQSCQSTKNSITILHETP